LHPKKNKIRIMNMKVTIQEISQNEHVNEVYSDDDILIIDNVRKLVDPPVTRMSMNMLVICIRGKAEFNMNGERFAIHKNQVVICPANITLSDFMVSPDFDFKAMFFTTRILQSFLRDKISSWNKLLYVDHLHVLTMEDQDFAYYWHFYEMLRMNIEPNENIPFRVEIIQSLLRAAFLALCGRMEQKRGEDEVHGKKGQASDTLFQRFLLLLSNSEVKHRTVDSYANALCVSPKYLTVVCKKSSGKSASEWITEHVMEDIRYQLCHTDHTIKQICSILGFASPSFFGKYVRMHFGMTPIKLRRS